MSPATTPEPKTWTRATVSATDLNREIRDQLRDMQNRVLALQSGGGGAFYPTGTIIAWSGATIPNGWLLCDGSIQNSNNEPGLFTAIGNAYNTGGEGANEFRVPKLNEALPRSGNGVSGTGAAKSVGVGAGQNSVTWSHSFSPNITQSSNASGAHFHNANAELFHSASANEHNFVYDHGHSYNSGDGGGHNHVGYASGGDHDHGGTNAAGANVSRPTGNLLTCLAHNHNISATGVNTSTDGAHTHNQSGAGGSSNNVGGFPISPNTNTSKTSGGFYAQNSNHQHTLDHTHSFSTSHATIDLVPPSVSVNYLIRR